MVQNYGVIFNEAAIVWQTIMATIQAVDSGFSLDDRRKARAARFGQAVAPTADDVVLMAKKVSESEKFEELVVTALESAIRADGEHRFKALVRIVRQGMNDRDDATIDHRRIVVRTVAMIEPVDLRFLVVVAEGPAGRVPHPEDPERLQAGGTRVEVLRSTFEAVVGTHEAVLSRLVSLGVAYDCAVGTFGYEPTWAVTDFGLEVLAYLDDGESL